MREREFDRSRTIDQKKRPVRLTAKQAPHRPGISRGARFARTRAMTFLLYRRQPAYHQRKTW